jgi:hypothetical protein
MPPRGWYSRKSTPKSVSGVLRGGAHGKQQQGLGCVEDRIVALQPFLPEVKDLSLFGMMSIKGKILAGDILDALAALVTIDGEKGSLPALEADSPEKCGPFLAVLHPPSLDDAAPHSPGRRSNRIIS